MWNRLIPIGLALVALVGGVSARAQSDAAGVRDRASLFSAGAVRQANEALDAVRRDHRWQVLIETIDTLNGDSIAERALSNAKDRNVKGLYILISKQEHNLRAIPSPSAKAVFTQPRLEALTKTLTDAFKAQKFDDGLRDVVAQIERGLGPPKRSGPLEVGVRDKAGLFSGDAARRAGEALKEVESKKKWQTVIETVRTLDGKDVKDLAVSNAGALKVHGLYILIAKDEHKVFVEPSDSARSVFPKERAEELARTITADFKAGSFDRGLSDAVAAIRKDVGLGPEPAAIALTSPAPAAPANYRARETSQEAKSVPASKEMKPEPPPAPEVKPTKPEPVAVVPPPVSTPPPARTIPAARNSTMIPMLIVGGLGILFFLWLLSKVFGGGSRPPAPVQIVNQVPNPGYAPGTPQGPGYAPQQPRSAPPYQPQPAPGGYAPAPGYGPPPGYPQPGYAPPQPHQGGGFISGAIGGLGGAVVGNILYDKFGRPHTQEGAPVGHAGVVPPVPPVPPVAPQETYDPNAGAGGDWGTPAPDAGAGGDWGTPAAEAPDPGAGGDWGAPAPEPAPDAGAGGDWGAPAPEPDAGGGGDWGGDSGGSGEPDQGGSW